MKYEKEDTRYKIGEVSHILGITIDTIRFLESRKIINPYKDCKSGYRYFEAWDINYLLEYKRWRSFEFSVSEVTEILNERSLKEVYEKLTEREEQLIKGIEHYKRLLKETIRHKHWFNRIEECLWKCNVEESPDVVRYNHRFNYIYDKSHEMQEMTKKWLELAPFVRFHVEVPECVIINREINNDYMWGFELDFQDAQVFGIETKPPVERLSPRLCVHTIITAGTKGTFSSKLLNHVVEYMDEHSYEIGGAATGSLIVRVHEGEEYVRYIDIWVPIK